MAVGGWRNVCCQHGSLVDCLFSVQDGHEVGPVML
jgi:hypothetical protein